MRSSVNDGATNHKFNSGMRNFSNAERKVYCLVAFAFTRRKIRIILYQALLKNQMLTVANMSLRLLLCIRRCERKPLPMYFTLAKDILTTPVSCFQTFSLERANCFKPSIARKQTNSVVILICFSCAILSNTIGWGLQRQTKGHFEKKNQMSF